LRLIEHLPNIYNVKVNKADLMILNNKTTYNILANVTAIVFG